MSEDVGTIISRDPNYTNHDFEKKIPRLTYMTGDHIGRRILLADDRITLGRSIDATILVM